MNHTVLMERGRKASRHVARWIARIIGGLLAAFGVLGMLTPIPFGIVFFIVGLMFLVPTTPGAAALVKKARAKIGLFDRSMMAISRRLPLPYRRILKMTEPDQIL